ncbi:putative breast cancer anti-estrogen resistance protein 1-like isoform X1 [Apostichopus japonicus]|uniref:Putative breast cancer anti-estrogen resistance protein 1-like isoform X1 n=1 Tax=Stichopus japonicus TaxID=307972 RepID=A0A2G8KXM5_STIJA|nr:putative breast cancer anti-estrogen resistance protein 1-like isoform X1 [Apostichopus japonicus]
MEGICRMFLLRRYTTTRPEAPDELEFRKGDVITVIEQNTGGLEGWWLCSLNGRQGIAPGNRLKIMAGMYDTSFVNSKLKKSAEFELSIIH